MLPLVRLSVCPAEQCVTDAPYLSCLFGIEQTLQCMQLGNGAVASRLTGMDAHAGRTF